MKLDLTKVNNDNNINGSQEASDFLNDNNN
jgi:hypothetical protein